MTHIPNRLDVKTDLQRSVMASFSQNTLDDTNAKTFLNKAEQNLEFLKNKIDKKAYLQAKVRIAKAKNAKNPIDKRREDLLTASCLI